MRSPKTSGQKSRHLVKSGSMKSKGSMQDKFSPSPVKKQAENRERSEGYRSNTGGEYKSPGRHHNFSSGKKHPKVNSAPYGKPIEIIKGK